MEMNGSQVITASVARTWEALNDPETLKACIPGCEAIEPVGDNIWMVALNVRIGPVGARFKGRLALTNIVQPNAYTIDFEGQGGAAFARGSADVRLSPASEDAGPNDMGQAEAITDGDGAATLLEYGVNAQVGGRIAQIGARLVDAAGRKLADDFFRRFNEQVGERDG